MGDQALTDWCRISREGEALVIAPKGEWRLTVLGDIAKLIPGKSGSAVDKLVVDGSELSSLDTSGALLLLRIAKRFGFQGRTIQFRKFSDRARKIFALVLSAQELDSHPAPEAPLSVVQKIGEESLRILDGIRGLVEFFGHLWAAALQYLRRPRLFRRREFTVQLELVLVDALPIVGLMSALIGIVVAYLFAIQLLKYGANIFIVDGVALAMVRELSPLIVAIIVAGRSGSAFTAQLGTMKLNEEIDALRTLGLSPMHVLVIPRLLALMLATPLLVFVGDIVGILGGYVIANAYADLTFATFFARVQSHLPIGSFFIGLGKAPVFAFFIGLIGCRMGLTVENDARSVGLHTTSTVVQSIVSIIILDAAFATIFANVGLFNAGG